MIKRILAFFLILLSFMSISYAAETLICNIEQDVSIPFSNVLFYAHDNLSSNIAIDNSVLSLDSPYTYSLNCESDFGKVNFYNVNISSDIKDPCLGDEKVIYVAQDTNSRVSKKYNTNYQNVLCVSLPQGFSDFDIVWYNEANGEFNPAQLGYTCMFKTNSDVNGHVSSCSSTYNSGESYPLSVWARLFESLDSLNCNADCTSKLDGRVYVGCNSKVPTCDIPLACNGALLGTYVTYSHEQEIQCSAPWDKFRTKVFTTAKLKVEADISDCLNLIKKSHVMFLDNEQVVMNIYICQD